MKRRDSIWTAPYGWRYIHWTSLKLNARQLNVLRRIEKQRISQGYIRIYVGDIETDDNLPLFLIDYVAWLSTRINPFAETLILDRYIRQARIAALGIPRCKAINSYTPAFTRGYAAQHLLLLNADLYGFAWSADVTGQLRRHLFPSIPDCHGSAIIVHGSIDALRNPQFVIEFLNSLRGIYGPYWQAVHPCDYSDSRLSVRNDSRLSYVPAVCVGASRRIPSALNGPIVPILPVPIVPPVLAAAAAA